MVSANGMALGLIAMLNHDFLTSGFFAVPGRESSCRHDGEWGSIFTKRLHPRRVFYCR
jgi:hypothetical protein